MGAGVLFAGAGAAALAGLGGGALGRWGGVWRAAEEPDLAFLIRIRIMIKITMVIIEFTSDKYSYIWSYCMIL